LVQQLKAGLNTHVECVETKIFESIVKQSQTACQILKNNKKFSDAKEINVVGVSQGGLVGRAIVEQCEVSDKTKVRNLLTIGTPNMGFEDIPEGICQMINVPKDNFFCSMNMMLIKKILLSEKIQDTLGPAGYFRNPDDLENYKKKLQVPRQIEQRNRQ